MNARNNRRNGPCGVARRSSTAAPPSASGRNAISSILAPPLRDDASSRLLPPRLAKFRRCSESRRWVELTPVSTDLPDLAAFAPERLMPTSEIALEDADRLFGIGDRMPDPLRMTGVPFQDRKRGVGRGGIDDVAKSNPHVEHFEHLMIFHVPVSLDQSENGVG